MKVVYHLFLVPYLARVFAQEQVIFNSSHASWIKQSLADASPQVKGASSAGKLEPEKWKHAGKEYIKQSGFSCTLYS